MFVLSSMCVSTSGGSGRRESKKRRPKKTLREVGRYWKPKRTDSCVNLRHHHTQYSSIASACIGRGGSVEGRVNREEQPAQPGGGGECGITVNRLFNTRSINMLSRKEKVTLVFYLFVWSQDGTLFGDFPAHDRIARAPSSPWHGHQMPSQRD